MQQKPSLCLQAINIIELFSNLFALQSINDILNNCYQLNRIFKFVKYAH